MSSLPPGPGGMRRDLVWLAAGAAVLFALFLGARDLWNPNEPIYGQAVAEMHAAGRWLVPTVNGLPFAEKPPLYFWLARGAALLLGGVDEFALRLPSAAVGIVGVLLLYVFLCRRVGVVRARVAALLFATTYQVFWTARAAQMDLLLAVCVAGAVFAAAGVIDGTLRPLRGAGLAGATAGLGFLAKGPVAWICIGLTVALYLAASRRSPRGLGRPLAVAGLVAVACVLPWIAALWATGETAFLHEALWRQNVTRFLTPWDHARPWWYYLANFWLDLAPWALFLPLAWRLADRDDAERRLDLLAWCWIAAVVGFFSLSSSKRGVYVLPAAPAVAILVAGVFERLLHGTLERGRRIGVDALAGVLGGLLLAAAALVRLQVPARAPELGAPGRAAALLLAAGGAAVLSGLLMRRREPLATPTALLASVLSIYVLAGVWLLPAADAVKSARPFCLEVIARVAPDQPLATYREWQWRAGYSYYTGRRIERLTSPRELRDYWSAPGPAFLIVEGNFDEVREVLGDVEPVLRGRVGSQEVLLLSNRPGG